MSHPRSWLRRVLRTLRVCLVGALLLLLWSLAEIAASSFRPIVAAALLFFLTALFVWWHWVRPARRRRRPGPADVRLRAVPRAAIRPLAGGILVACIAVQALYLVHLRFLPVPAEDPFAAAFEMLNQPWGWLPLFLMAIVMAPMIEETVFRGWIQRPLERFWGPVPAVAISALLFSLVHFIPEYIPYYFIVGVVLGSLVVLTRSLLTSIALHVVFNIQAVILTLVGGDLAQEVALAEQDLVVAAAGAVVIGGGILLSRTVREIRPIVQTRRRVVATISGQPEPV